MVDALVLVALTFDFRTVFEIEVDLLRLSTLLLATRGCSTSSCKRMVRPWEYQIRGNQAIEEIRAAMISENCGVRHGLMDDRSRCTHFDGTIHTRVTTQHVQNSA